MRILYLRNDYLKIFILIIIVFFKIISLSVILHFLQDEKFFLGLKNFFLLGKYPFLFLQIT
jgi:hypothetical protein